MGGGAPAGALRGSGVGLRPTDDVEAEAPLPGRFFLNRKRKEVGRRPTSSLFLSQQRGGRPAALLLVRHKVAPRAGREGLLLLFHMEGQPEAAPLLWYAVEVGRRSRPSDLIVVFFCLRG